MYLPAVASKTISLSRNCPGYMVDRVWPFCIVDLSPLDRAYELGMEPRLYTGPIRFSPRVLETMIEREGSLFISRGVNM